MTIRKCRFPGVIIDPVQVLVDAIAEKLGTKLIIDGSTVKHKLLLEQLKQELESIVDDYVFSGPYSDYFPDEYKGGTLFFKPEYDLFFEMHHAYYIRFGEFPNHRQLKDYFRLGDRTLSPYGMKGGKFSLRWDSWSKILKIAGVMEFQIRLGDFSGELTGDPDFNLVEAVLRFGEIRGIHYHIKDDPYSYDWDSEELKRLHCTVLLIRDLGIDVLTLDPIMPASFDKSPSSKDIRFQRNHIFASDKDSIDPNRMTLPMVTEHKKHEGKEQLILELLKHRMSGNRECPDYYKNQMPNDWQDKWAEYLERWDCMENEGLEKFMDQYLSEYDGTNYFLDRFYSGTKPGFIDEDIKEVLQNWVDQDNPMPKMPSYAQELLPKDRQTSLDNFLGDRS